jgi:hypothetical protein
MAKESVYASLAIDLRSGSAVEYSLDRLEATIITTGAYSEAARRASYVATLLLLNQERAA